ncbi:hypothetical protein ACFPOU_07235 [Massilia jejuensis]|uniref:Uncharacterized protein n=1 Tax=Massilia jejuensis TaxID=648894 RepID=A0ABW0PE38_9BURK
MAENLKQIHAWSTTKILIILLLLGDLAFMIIHVFHKLTQYLANSISNIGMDSEYAVIYHYLDIDFLQKVTPYFANSLFNIEMDNGYAEAYQHLKFIGIIFVFFYLCIKQKIWSFFPWMLLFSYFLLDDSFQLHERLGSVIASGIAFSPPFGLRRQDLGELAVTMTAGLIILPSLMLAYYLGCAPIRKIYHNLLLLLSLLVFFGVGVDMVHAVFMNSPIFSPIFGVIEDGGEMLAVSMFASYSFFLLKKFINLKDAAVMHSTNVQQSIATATANQ